MTNKTYVFGHKNPDTDSVTAAISLAFLKKLKKQDVEPFILGEINNETKFVLNYFKVAKPQYLNDVKLQIKDLKYKKDCYLNQKDTLDTLYNYMHEKEITGVPICNDKKEFLGIVTMKDLLKTIIDPNYDEINTSYENILRIVKGKEVYRFHEEIKGKVILSAYKTTDFEENINLSSNNILIIGNRFNIIKKAISKHVKLIIVVGTHKLGDDTLSLAKSKKVSIITTKEESLYVSKMVLLSNYIKNILSMVNYAVIEENMYVNDFLVIANKYKFTNYPIVDRKGKILGLLRSEDLHEKMRKKVILVDHNEATQSVEGLDEADIIEIIDHHKVGNINSASPINIRNMAVGSTNTIIYEMYKENKVKPPKEIAGLMLSGIISDTLLFNSPTTTNYDRKAVEALARIAKVNIVDYSKKMFEAAASIRGKTIEELIYNDFKAFNIGNRKIGIGQMTVIDYQKVLKDKHRYLQVIEKISKEHEYDILAFCITDIINSNTYLLYNENSKTIFETVFNLKDIYEGYELKGVVSRKKQIIPLLMEGLN